MFPTGMTFSARFDFNLMEVEYEIKIQDSKFYNTFKLPKFQQDNEFKFFRFSMRLLENSGIKTIRILD